LLASLLAVLGAAAPAMGQATAQPTQEDRLAVVTRDDVYVRAGPADSYYPFGRMRAGDVVRVIGEKFNWARVATVGPAFEEFFGYIRYPLDDTGRFRLAEDGRTGRTMGRLDLLAPNLNTNYTPRDSWKRIMLLEADVEVTVIETLQTEREIVQKVVLPEKAVGWISTSFLRAATDQEVAAFEAALAGETLPTEAPAPDPEQAPEPMPAAPGTEQDAATGEEQPAAVEMGNPETTPQTEEPAPAQTGQQQPVASPEPVLPEPVVGEPAPAEPVNELQAKLENIEEAFKELRKQPMETAEVMPLRHLYLQLAEEAADEPALQRFANARARQLELWAEIQNQQIELAMLRKRLELTAEESQAVRTAMEMRASYAGVGKLGVSIIYDGKNLPKLFRLQDPTSGRTIAYLRPDKDFDLLGMLDQLIGVVGDKTYDGSLRLNIIVPRRIDLLGPQP
jgi:hypothetical protein